jgi:regulatory protein
MARQALSLKARAIGLLAQREHSRSELRRKLLRILQQQQQRARAASAAADRAADLIPCDGQEGRPAQREDDDRACRWADDCAQSGINGDDGPDNQATVEALLDALAADGYLDETRFVESRLHVRAGRFGAQRIQQELAQHGLRLDPVQQADLRATELDRAREVWLRRFGAEPGREPLEQARQMRFLLARGFAADVVRRLMRAP